jgi:hypothetical protein
MHTIIGGSNFDKTVDYASTQQGKCTTAPISIDKSSYWTREFRYSTFQKLLCEVTCGRGLKRFIIIQLLYGSSIVQLFGGKVHHDPG